MCKESATKNTVELGTWRGTRKQLDGRRESVARGVVGMKVDSMWQSKAPKGSGEVAVNKHGTRHGHDGAPKAFDGRVLESRLGSRNFVANEKTCDERLELVAGELTTAISTEGACGTEVVCVGQPEAHTRYGISFGLKIVDLRKARKDVDEAARARMTKDGFGFEDFQVDVDKVAKSGDSASDERAHGGNSGLSDRAHGTGRTKSDG